jgi:hypothetical protein
MRVAAALRCMSPLLDHVRTYFLSKSCNFACGALQEGDENIT